MAIRHLIVILVLTLSIFGLIFIASSSVVTAARDFGDKWYYVKHQVGWFIIGLVGFLFASRIPIKVLEKYAVHILFGSAFLLTIVLIPGVGVSLLGARRWLNLGFFTLQPAEFSKLALIIYLSALLKNPSRKFAPFLSVSLLFSLLVILEPDLGTSLVLIGVAVVMYFGSGGNVFHLLAFLPILSLAVLALVLVSPYRAARLKTFFDYTRDPLGASYQIHQALIGLGSGGIMGVGIGQSRQKYEFLPEVATDSIFAVVGEELGFVGTIFVVGILYTLISQGLKVVNVEGSAFSRNLSLGIVSWIGLQSLINISSIIALTPLTGVPLPFISYGGSSLVIILIASGILVNISKNQ